MKAKVLTISSLFLVLSFSCKKKKPDPVVIPGNSTGIEFISLTAVKDTLVVGEQTDITANAKGDGLTYKWEAPIGILSGEGKTIQFTACCSGDHVVTCKIEDTKGNVAEKTINIFANE